MTDYNIIRAIMAVQVDNRNVEAARVQTIFTKHGCIIQMRLGIHPGVQKECSAEGLIILDLNGSVDEVDALETELNGIDGIQATKMVVPVMGTTT